MSRQTTQQELTGAYSPRCRVFEERIDIPRANIVCTMKLRRGIARARRLRPRAAHDEVAARDVLQQFCGITGYCASAGYWTTAMPPAHLMASMPAVPSGRELRNELDQGVHSAGRGADDHHSLLVQAISSGVARGKKGAGSQDNVPHGLRTWVPASIGSNDRHSG
jgi:hypothetical protein